VDAFRYSVYGLTLESAFGLPCVPADSGTQPDVRVTTGRDSHFARARAERHAADSQQWFLCRRLTDETTYLRWRDLCEFLVSPDGREIRCRCLDASAVEAFNVYLLGQVLSFSLLALGIEALHGTAVALNNDTAVLFVGDCGYGKSTLAAALLARGLRVVTDDLVVLEERADTFVIHPGVPRLKLFESVHHALLQPRFAAAPMNNGTGKAVVALGPDETTDRVLPLTAFYVLSDPEEPVVEGEEAIAIEPVEGRDAFLAVTRAAFNLIVLDRQRCANQFAWAARLSGAIPVRRVSYPRRLSLLPAVCDAVIADARQRAAIAAASTSRLPDTLSLSDSISASRGELSL